MVMISSFGTTKDGEEIKKITLQSKTPGGIQAHIITYGATLQSLYVPDKDGKLADIVLGYDSIAEYEINNPYFGATVGRVSGRISGAEFKVNDKLYTIPKNNGDLCLHGGFKGITRRAWEIVKAQDTSVTLSYTSPDGEEGFPGDFKVSVTYSLNENGNSLTIEYNATVEAPCPVMLTNHAYFNLGGEGNGVVDDHMIHIQASNILALDTNLVPTGELEGLTNNIIDLRVMTRLGNKFSEMSGPNAGFDHYYVLDKKSDEHIAEAYEPVSCRRMRVTTDQLGVQFYTANFLDGEPGKNGKKYPYHGGFCMETHGYPNAINRPSFPGVVLNPGEEYKQKTTYAFDIQL